MATNRNRPNRRATVKKQEVNTIESMCAKLDRIALRMGQIEHCDPQSIQHAQELVLIASHILNTSPDPNIEADSDDDDEDSDDDDEEDPPRPRLNLRERWAGTLPTIDSYAASKQRKAPEGPEESVKLTPKQQLEVQKRNAQRIAAMKSKDGIAGGHPDVYDTTYDFGPDHVCNSCGNKVIDHKVDKNLPIQQTSEGPMQAYIICDRTRCYIPVA